MFVPLVASEAHADCDRVEKAVAEAAVQQLTPGAEWAAWCEACDGVGPVTYQVGAATAGPTEDGTAYEVTIDGAIVDLAYTWVRRGHGYTNLASLAGCPTTGSTRFELPSDPPPRIEPWFGSYQGRLTGLTIARVPGQPYGVRVRFFHPTGPARDLVDSFADFAPASADSLWLSTWYWSMCSLTIVHTADGIGVKPDEYCPDEMGALAGLYRRVAPP